MKNLSKFDIGMIIAFAVVALIGAGAWWYLSGQLQTAQGDVTNAKADFDRLSTSGNLVVSNANKAALQSNIELLKSQLDPLIQNRLAPPKSDLANVTRQNPVDWKNHLDDEVHRLTGEAGHNNVKLPKNFYFSFSRYLSQNPGDEETVVLSKQLLGVEEIADILIGAPVKGIQAIRRTYEEDHSNASTYSPIGLVGEADRLPGNSINAGSGVYTVYPFEVEFDTTTPALRQIIDKLIQSPYVFVIRSISVQNSQPNPPQVTDLDKLAGTPATSVVDSSPGAVAAATSTKPPQFLFGNAMLHIRARIDMIEWKEPPSTVSSTSK
ncbi:MAG: Amuc_1100 family pilus-like protein [Methylacidiphilales bacterium]|nr:Amuc_1100 family pilus-like protein [Candidatus Methylacidiphilales bacterium]